MTQRTDKVEGNWRAIVTDNLDITCSGRVKIDIPGLRLKDMWAEPAIQVGGSDVHGSYTIPRIGDKLFVFFDGGNIAHPIYFATSPAQKDIPKAFSGGRDPVVAARNSSALVTPKWSEPTTNATVEYPYGQGVKFPGGTLVIVDESGDESKVAVYHPANSYSEYAGDGSHVGRIATDDYEIIMGDLFVYVGGSLSALIAKDFDIEVQGNYEQKVLGDLSYETVGNVDHKITGTLTETVVGNIDIKTADAYTLVANAITLKTLKFSLIAPIIVFQAATSITLNSPLIALQGAMVKIGAGTAPVLTALTAFCPWCGRPVGPGLPTVLAG